MIDLALKFLVDELNAYLAARTGSSFGAVELGPLVDDAGKWTIASNQVRLSVVNLEEERVLRSPVPEPTLVAGKLAAREPALRVVLHLLFAARFQDYGQAWRALSLVLQFFQSHRSLTPHEYPGLDPRIEKLVFDLQSPGYEQLNQLWAFLGSKHLPSALYRARLITLQDVAPAGVGPPVTTLTGDLHRL